AGAPQFVTEQLTQPGAGQAEGIVVSIRSLEHERLGQDAGDTRRLDLEAARREATGPHGVPVIEQGLYRSLLHARVPVGVAPGRTALPLCRNGTAVHASGGSWPTRAPIMPCFFF